jgi:NTP pyrophosphatase (non-canonical NTP hydrolase)
MKLELLDEPRPHCEACDCDQCQEWDAVYYANQHAERQYLHFLITYLGSEAAEVAHAASKVIIFGPEDDYDGRNAATTWESLEAELDDLYTIVDILRELGKPLLSTMERRLVKKEKVREMYFYAARRSLIDLPTIHVKDNQN